MIKIYNTLTRKKERFVPLADGMVKMYSCGQTVYNDIHLGNARFYVVFDAIRRYLEYRGYTVHYVQNFTDVEDKIIVRAREKGVCPQEIAKTYIRHTFEDMEALNVKRATVHPLATEEMPEIIGMIQALVDKGFAYAVNGSVFFRTSSLPGYGKLSRKNPDDLEAGARVEVNADKQSPMDFVLWKPDKPGEPFWESPWGTGRPGWHIECSAMVKKYLGPTVDIHGGGADLIFPHHENEIAQSEAANTAPLAKYWMHCGILTVNHKKMSKSTGNFHTLREVAECFPYDVIRFFLVSGHYRMPMEYGTHLLESAAQALTRIKNCRDSIVPSKESRPGNETEPAADATVNFSKLTLPEEAKTFRRAFEAAMDDDFNTADAMAAIFEMVKYINTSKPRELETAMALRDELDFLCGLLGIRFEETAQKLDADIEALISLRQEARANKNWAEADRIRDELLARGIALKDTPGGVQWTRK